MKETDLAQPVIAWLEAQHWDVYQEVLMHGGVADLVAKQGSLTWIVELRRTLGFDLLAQASHRMYWAHFVSVAVPVVQNSRARVEAEHVFRDRGLGILLVANHVKQVAEPRLNRSLSKFWRRHGSLSTYGLVEVRAEQKVMARAGTPNGGHWTPYRQTCTEVLRRVREKPGLTTKEVFDHLKHHYASNAGARSSLLKWVLEDKVPGVVVRREGRSFRWYPKEGV